MNFARTLCWSLTLLPWCVGGSVLADESPRLPDRYAEVVLRVEGMI